MKTMNKVRGTEKWLCNYIDQRQFNVQKIGFTLLYHSQMPHYLLDKWASTTLTSLSCYSYYSA